MTHDNDADAVEFDDIVTLALASSAARAGVAPRAEVKRELLARLIDSKASSPFDASGMSSTSSESPVPPGFSFRFAAEQDWVPHPVPGIRMKVLAMNHAGGYATLLLDVKPGTRFPAHYHSGAEECYVLSGSLYTCDRRMEAGDFLHADANTDHGELWTEEGCSVLLVVPPEDYMPEPARG